MLRKARRSTVGLFVGDRELAHIHKDGSFDIPLPVEIGRNQVRLGAVTHHPEHDDLGWFRGSIKNDSAKWLTRMAHVLYEISKRGIDDEMSQEEIQILCVSEQCVNALRRLAFRWNLSLGKYEPFEQEVSPATSFSALPMGNYVEAVSFRRRGIAISTKHKNVAIPLTFRKVLVSSS